MTAQTDYAMPTGPMPLMQVRHGAPLWEQGLVTLWILVTTVTFPKDELFLYPLVLFFIGSIYLRRSQMVPFILRNWLIFLLPLWAMSSYLWSPIPQHSLRLGMFMLLTVTIAVYIAGRLSLRQIVQSVFVANIVVIAIVAPQMGTFELGGPFGEKNIFAWRMAFALLSALAVALDRKGPQLLRLTALPIIPVAFVFMYMAKSATALVMSSAAVLVLLIVWLFWTNVSRVRHLRLMVIFALLLTTIIGALFLVLMPNNEIAAKFLESIGKDTTLTGRTMLWHTGREVVKEHPWLGYGAGAYWQANVGTAQTLLELSYKDPGTNFSFHNSYLEYQVHLGRVGLGLLILSVGWSLYRSVLGWLRSQDVMHSFILLMALILFMISFTEAILFTVFDIGVTLFFIAAASSFVQEHSQSTANLEGMYPQSPEEAAALARGYGQ